MAIQGRVAADLQEPAACIVEGQEGRAALLASQHNRLFGDRMVELPCVVPVAQEDNASLRHLHMCKDTTLENRKRQVRRPIYRRPLCADRPSSDKPNGLCIDAGSQTPPNWCKLKRGGGLGQGDMAFCLSSATGRQQQRAMTSGQGTQQHHQGALGTNPTQSSLRPPTLAQLGPRGRRYATHGLNGATRRELRAIPDKDN